MTVNFIQFSLYHSSESRDILDPKERHRKFLNMAFIGLLFLGMLMNFAKDVQHARRQVIYLEGIKYLYIM